VRLRNERTLSTVGFQHLKRTVRRAVVYGIDAKVLEGLCAYAIKGTLQIAFDVVARNYDCDLITVWNALRHNHPAAYAARDAIYQSSENDDIKRLKGNVISMSKECHVDLKGSFCVKISAYK
jgi:hypothetical protein